MITTPHSRSGATLRFAPHLTTLIRWFDSWAGGKADWEHKSLRVDWLRCLPFVFMHAMCAAVFWVGWSWSAVVAAAVLYVIRMFAITAFYHRYFSHRAFKTSRWFQFTGAVLGAASIQRGPLWWAAHHRRHHATSDQADDIHSPRHHGFLWSHMGWFTANANFTTDRRAVPDLIKFPELCLLDRFDIVVPLLLAAFLYGLGVALASLAPALGTSGMQMVIWGGVLSTVVLYHATYTINSLAHRMGKRRYETQDDSGNSLLLALLTFGEGWHNNHHHYPAAVRQGFYWWEIDLTYYLLAFLSWTGLIWDLKPIPEQVRGAKCLDKAA